MTFDDTFKGLLLLKSPTSIKSVKCSKLVFRYTGGLNINWAGEHEVLRKADDGIMRGVV